MERRFLQQQAEEELGKGVRTQKFVEAALLRWGVSVCAKRVQPLVKKTSLQHWIYGETFSFANATRDIWSMFISGGYAHYMVFSGLERMGGT